MQRYAEWQAQGRGLRACARSWWCVSVVAWSGVAWSGMVTFSGAAGHYFLPRPTGSAARAHCASMAAGMHDAPLCIIAW